MMFRCSDFPIFQSSSIPVFEPCNITFFHSPLSPFAPVKLNFLSLVPRPSSLFLLPRHRDLYPLFRTDEVIVVVFAEIDLHPVNLAAEDAAVAVVIGSNRR